MYKILMVEDEQDVLDIAQKRLEHLGFDVSVARNGQQAWETTMKVVPDLIITDMVMPMMSGFELCKAVKNHTETRNIPIIVLSAKTSMEDSFIYLGIKDFIPKPISMASLEEKINQRLRSTAFIKQQHGKVLVHAVRPAVLSQVEDLVRQDSRWMGMYAKNARELFAQATSAVPDIVLVDLFMDDVPADEMIKALKSLTKLRNTRFFTYYSGLTDSPDSVANQAKMIEVQYLKRTAEENGAEEYWGAFNTGNFMHLINVAQDSTREHPVA